MKIILRFSLILAFILLYCTSQTFALYLKEYSDNSVVEHQGKSPMFLAFVADWCPHCQAIKPELERLGKAISSDPKLIMAVVQAEANPTLGQKYKVDGVPSLIFVDEKDPNSFEEYNFHLYAESIADWINKKLGHAAIKIEKSEEYIKFLERDALRERATVPELAKEELEKILNDKNAPKVIHLFNENDSELEGKKALLNEVYRMFYDDGLTFAHVRLDEFKDRMTDEQTEKKPSLIFVRMDEEKEQCDREQCSLENFVACDHCDTKEEILEFLNNQLFGHLLEESESVDKAADESQTSKA